MMELVPVQNEASRLKMAAWAGRVLGLEFDQPMIVFHVADPHAVTSHHGGCVIFNHYDGVSIELTICADGALNRRVMRQMANYAFNDNGVRRVTVRCRAFSRAARMAEKAGFVREGRLRQAYANGEDALIYGMLREECRFLRSKNEPSPQAAQQ
jgi:RimJ/RimL family protein N-acetyltransferase